MQKNVLKCVIMHTADILVYFDLVEPSDLPFNRYPSGFGSEKSKDNPFQISNLYFVLCFSFQQEVIP